MPRFNADALVKLPHEDMAKAIKHWNQSKMLETEAWSFWRGDNQLPSTEDWRVWLVMAGRGFGKTRMGAEWVSKVALANHGARIALIGATLTEARSAKRDG